MYTFFVTMSLVFVASSCPGPNTILVTQNSLAFGRKIGMITATGLVIGIIFWLVVLFFGLSYIMEKPKILFILHVFGSLYILYISYMVFQTKINFETENTLHNKTFFWQGIISTLFNAEVPMFYGSILTNVFSHNPEIVNSFSQILIYFVGFMCVESFVFFSAAYFVSVVRHFVLKYFKIIKIFASIGILYFALRMALKAYSEYQLLIT